MTWSLARDLEADVDHRRHQADGNVAFIATPSFDGQIGPGVYAGPVGRLLLVSYLGWIARVGLHAIQLTRQTHRMVLDRISVPTPGQPAEVA